MTVAVQRCAGCGVSLGSVAQGDLRGIPAKLCIGCLTQARAKMILQVLPEPDEGLQWDRLNEWEQDFLTSIRRQFAARGTVTERQYEVLENLWKKYP